MKIISAIAETLCIKREREGGMNFEVSSDFFSALYLKAARRRHHQ
jgi:hypothetical protein